VKEILVAPGNTGIKEVDKVQLVELNVKNTKVYIMSLCNFFLDQPYITSFSSLESCQMEQGQ